MSQTILSFHISRLYTVPPLTVDHLDGQSSETEPYLHGSLTESATNDHCDRGSSEAPWGNVEHTVCRVLVLLIIHYVYIYPDIPWPICIHKDKYEIESLICPQQIPDE
jgi:hypothetical protein